MGGTEADIDDFGGAFTLQRADFQALLDALSKLGYDIIAPTMKDGAIVYGAIRAVEELPIGWTDDQGPGRYRLSKRLDGALFGYAVGPHSWKKYLHPPERELWRAKRNGNAVTFKTKPPDKQKRAFLGVRACEIAAIDIQSRVFVDDLYSDESYETRRRNTMVIAVNCSSPAETCFCTSMDTGPAVSGGYDLLITEVVEENAHVFVMKAASNAGQAVLAQLPLKTASPADVASSRAVIRGAEQAISRTMDTEGLRELLQENPEHPQWDDVASRCLSCTNCTAVCPTCFCTTVADHTGLSGEESRRLQTWDSCFSGAFSELSGGSVRQSTKSRYRQWMTHKLSTWIDQFGASGCVGCGRCIAWCPVGIDITAEVTSLRAKPKKEA